MPSNHTETRSYLGFWARFVAFLVDSLASLIPISVVAALVLPDLDVAGIDLNNPEAARTFLLAAVPRLTFDVVLLAIMVLAFWIAFAATPGKMIFRSIIVDATTGQSVPSSRLVLRYLGYFPGIFALGLGFFWIAFDGRKQGWHDKIANTVVVQEPRQRKTARRPRNDEGKGN